MSSPTHFWCWLFIFAAFCPTLTQGNTILPNSPFILWLDDHRETLRATAIEAPEQNGIVTTNLPVISQIVYASQTDDIYVLVDNHTPSLQRIDSGKLTFFAAINPAISSVRYDPIGNRMIWTDTEADVVRFRDFQGNTGVLFSIPDLQRAFALTGDGGFWFLTENENSEVSVHRYETESPAAPTGSILISHFGSLVDLEYDPLSEHFIYLFDDGAVFTYNLEFRYDDFIYHNAGIEEIGIEAASGQVYFNERYHGLRSTYYLPGKSTTPVTIQHDSDGPFLVYPDTVYGINLAKTSVTVREDEGLLQGKLIRFEDNDFADVLLTTSNGTAQAGTDYESVSYWFTFHQNQSEIDFSIPIIDNDIPDGDREFTVRIEDRQHKAPGPNHEMRVTIENDELPGIVQFQQSAYIIDEAEEMIQITLERIDGAYGSFSVRCTSSDADAQAGVDYEAFDSAITFSHGETERPLRINIGNDDFKKQGTRTFTLELSAPTNGAALGERSLISIHINDDELASSVDRSFALPEGTKGYSGPILLLPDERILAVVDDGSGFRLRAFFPDGSEDSSFACPLTFTFNSSIRLIERLTDGRLLIAGNNVGGGIDRDSVVRLMADGSVDPTFDYDPTDTYSSKSVGAILPLPDGKVMLGGLLRCQTDASAYLIRIHADGTLDESFPEIALPGSGCPWVYDLKRLDTGKILVVGNFTSANDVSGPIIRLNADGTVDPSFSNELPITLAAECLVLPDETIAVSIFGSSLYAGIYTLDQDGKLLESFRYSTDFRSAKTNIMRHHPQGGILLGGSFLSSGTPSIWSSLVRWHPDGPFEPLGKVAITSGIPTDMAFDTSGLLYVSGNFETFDGKSTPGLARVRISHELSLKAWKRWYANDATDTTQRASDGISYLEHFLYGTIPNQSRNTDRSPRSEWVEADTPSNRHLALRFYRHDLTEALQLKVFASSGLDTNNHDLIWSSTEDPNLLSEFVVEGDASNSGWICIRDQYRQKDAKQRFMFLQIEERLSD